MQTLSSVKTRAVEWELKISLDPGLWVEREEHSDFVVLVNWKYPGITQEFRKSLSGLRLEHKGPSSWVVENVAFEGQRISRWKGKRKVVCVESEDIPFWVKTGHGMNPLKGPGSEEKHLDKKLDAQCDTVSSWPRGLCLDNLSRRSQDTGERHTRSPKGCGVLSYMRVWFADDRTKNASSAEILCANLTRVQSGQALLVTGVPHLSGILPVPECRDAVPSEEQHDRSESCTSVPGTQRSPLLWELVG